MATTYKPTKIFPLLSPTTGFFPVYPAIPMVRTAKTTTHNPSALPAALKSLLSLAFLNLTFPPLAHEMVHGSPSPTQMFKTWLPKALLTAMAP